LLKFGKIQENIISGSV